MTTTLMRRPVLVLNGSYEPISIASTRRAMKMLVKGIAVIEEKHDIIVHSSWMLPSVIRLKVYRHVPSRIQEVTRKHIYQRDGHTCQYCGKQFSAMHLTLDHVQPKSRGGQKTFSNLVTSCQLCNRRKADRTPEEANMPLLNKPRPVTIHTAKEIMRNSGAEDPKWRRYLYFESEPNHPNQFA